VERRGGSQRIVVTLRLGSYGRALNLIECPHCATMIVPAGEGVCPSCRYSVNDELSPDQAANLVAAREPIAEHDAIEELGTVNRAMVFMAIGAAIVAVDLVRKLGGAPVGFIPNWMKGLIVLGLVASVIHLALKGRMLEQIARRAERKRCPSCGRNVSRHAPACPRCDHRFVRSMPRSPE
jgi:ethanolamine utilization microcompartment shell protein EutS